MPERISAFIKTPEEIAQINTALNSPGKHPVTGDAFIQIPDLRESNPYHIWGYNNSYELIATTRGLDFLRNFPNFINRMESDHFDPQLTSELDLQGLNGVVKKARLRNLSHPMGICIYVKALKPYLTRSINMTCVEQFIAMRLLQAKGVRVAQPLIATVHRIVTLEVAGPKPFGDKHKEELLSFLETLEHKREELVNEGKWNPKWGIDYQPGNYIITPDGLVAVDPIGTHSIFIN